MERLLHSSCGLVVWLGFVYISACGFTLNCIQGAPLVVRTPIPTLIPPKHSLAEPPDTNIEFNKCQVGATDLIGAWVAAGHTGDRAISIHGLNGQNCEGTSKRSSLCLRDNSVWFPGSLGCTSCLTRT